MTIHDLIHNGSYKVLNEGTDPGREIRDVFCCDLLSVAMSKGKEDAAWVTVMGNINTLAVMSLTDIACIILAEGAGMDEAGLKKAQEEGFTILCTDRPVFETALEIYQSL